MVPADALEQAVRAALAKLKGGELTGRVVRLAAERELGLPPDALLPQKDELLAVVSALLSAGGDAEVVDAAAEDGSGSLARRGRRSSACAGWSPWTRREAVVPRTV